MKQTKTILQIAFWMAAVLICATAALFESKVPFFGTLPTTTDINTLYTLEITSVVLTIAALPLALKGFSYITRVIKKSTIDSNKKEHLYCAYALMRIALLFIIILFNISLYYILNNESAMYCSLIGVVTLIFCFPGTKSINEFTETK